MTQTNINTVNRIATPSTPKMPKALQRRLAGSLNNDVESMLREMAFVLKMTQKVRDEMILEQSLAQ